jgi:hypothetical protein
MVVADGANGAIIAWIDERNARTTGKDIYAQRLNEDAEHQWAPQGLGVPICVAAGDQCEVRIVSDGRGGAIVVWKDARSSATMGANIYAQRVDAAGNMLWGENGRLICNAPGDQDMVTAITDGRNGAYIAWRDRRNGSGSQARVYVLRINSEGNRLSGWLENGIAASSATEYVHGPESPLLSGDGSGGVIVAWRGGGTGRAISANFFLQHFTGSGGREWSANGVPVLDPPAISNSDCHQLVGTRDGCIAVFDTEFHELCEGNPSTNPRLMAQRFTVASSSFVRNWGPPSTTCYTVRTIGGFQPQAVLTPDGADGVIVFLQDEDSYTSEPLRRFVAQRLSASGARMWTDVGQPVLSNHAYVEGVIVYRDHHGHRSADAVSDLANGGIVVWTDNRNGSSYPASNLDLFAQRMNGTTGARMWSENGMAVTTAPDNQLYPDAISGDRGGIIIVWQDERRGADNADIFAQRINPDGRYGR